jgi:DNA-binding SARP family transcriptional activator
MPEQLHRIFLTERQITCLLNLAESYLDTDSPDALLLDSVTRLREALPVPEKNYAARLQSLIR